MLASDSLKAEIAELEAEVARLKVEQLKARNTAESLKLAGNGCYGKLGSPYSVLYAP
jgi:hypothetical protein